MSDKGNFEFDQLDSFQEADLDNLYDTIQNEDLDVEEGGIKKKML